MLSVLLDLLLPPRCGGCASPGSWFCERCRRTLSRPREPLCVRCGRELAFVGEGCGCRRRLGAVSRIRAGFRYEGPLEKAIHRFKYEGWRSLGPALAELMVSGLAIEGPPAELVTAVPLHRNRLRSRGYNQSDLLATQIRRRLSLQPLPGKLTRLRDTPPQVGLDRLRRRLNVEGAFEYAGGPLAGRPVLLVDDVATTGSTLDACARALRATGSGPVVALTLARVEV